MELLFAVGGLVVGFVFGVLFGRKNKAKVEAELASLKAFVVKAQAAAAVKPL